MTKGVLLPLLGISLSANIWFLFGGKSELAPFKRLKGPEADHSREGPAVLERALTHLARPEDDVLDGLLSNLPTRPDRMERFAAWARESPTEALEWVENNAEGNTRIDLFERGIAEWSEVDPQAAAEWILGMANDFTYEAAVLDLSAKWGKKDGKAAASWIQRIPERQLRKTAAESLADTWGESDPFAAVNWCLAFERKHIDSPTFGRALAAWAETDPAAARSYFDSLPFDQTVANGASFLASASAETDPLATLDWARSIGDPATRWDAVNCAIDSWAQTKPKAAADFVSEMGATESIHHIDTIIRHWSSSDNAAAEIWVEGLPKGDLREAALGSLAESLMEAAPTRSLQWAIKLDSVSARDHACREIYSVWLEEDFDRATEWLETNKQNVPAQLADVLSKVRTSPENPGLDQQQSR